MIRRIQPHKLELIIIRKRCLLIISGLPGGKQVIEKKLKKAVRVFSGVVGMTIGMLPQELADAEGIKLGIADGKGDIGKVVELSFEGAVLDGKMEPVVHVIALRISVIIGGAGSNHKRIPGPGAIGGFAELKFSAGAYDEQNVVGKPVRA